MKGTLKGIPFFVQSLKGSGLPESVDGIPDCFSESLARRPTKGPPGACVIVRIIGLHSIPQTPYLQESLTT